MAEPGKDRNDRQDGRGLWGMGFELAGAVAGFTLVGYWVDHHFRTFPWGVLIGLALGLVGGMYNLIRESLAASRAADSRARKERDRRA
jgi:F0F1-type ATP synthase assembly protein I